MEKETDASALAPGELELFVQSMEPPIIENIGSKSWIDWHQRLQKLNQQAVLEASSIMEEQTKEALISHGKLPVLVYESICIFVWRVKIYPQILKLNPNLTNTFTVYMVLYHEAAAVGLLETVLYHEDGAQCLSDVIIDLVDYAQEMITSLISLTNAGYLEVKETKADQDENPVAELNRQQKDLQFDIAMRCISIIRYLSDHMDVEGAGAAIVSRLYRTHDTPSLMMHLLSIEPWKRLNEKGDTEYFVYGRWKRLSEEESQQLHRVEGQVWLCLRQLLLDKQLHDYYTIDNVRKTQFCRLQFKLTDCILDQVPPLGELKAWLCRLGVTDVAGLAPPTKKAAVGSLVIEIIPQIKDDYLKAVHKRCKSIAQRQVEQLFCPDRDAMVELARKLTETYAGDTAQMLDDGGAKCAACGDPAPRRCSRCKTAWYCGRECQVKQWPQHRDICDQFAKYG